MDSMFVCKETVLCRGWGKLSFLSLSLGLIRCATSLWVFELKKLGLV